jgi:glycosyltransferase 2 family protein
VTDAPERRVHAPELLSRGLRVFAAPADQPRARRATDLVLLVVSLAGAVLALVAYPPSAFERSLERLLAATPEWLDPVWAFLTDLLWLWAAALLALALVRRRLVPVGQAFAAMALAAVLGLLAARVAIGEWPDLVGALLGTDRGPRFPNVRVAEATAVLVTVGPHLVRPLRTVDRWIMLLGVLGAAVVGGSTPLGAVAAALIGIAAAAAVRLAWGTSIGRPGLDSVATGLAQLGVRARRLEEAERQVAGVFHVRARDDEGRPLLVKVYGRDAYDSQLVAKVWRSLWYRGSGPPLGLGRLQSAEHEAFVTLLARNGGLATREVVTAAATADDDALLVLRGEATSLASLASFDPASLDDDVLRAAWRALALLAELRIAHQRIEPSTLALVGGEVGFVEFGTATVAPDEHALGTDRAQLLVSTAVLAGEERALAVALGVLGRAELAALLPYLQSAALPTSLRRQSKVAEIDVDDLREQAALLVEAEPPELAKLRRVSWGSAIQIGLLGLASYVILSAAADIDWDEVRTSVADASWGWIVLGFLVAQLPRVTQAVSTLGSVPISLPFGPVYGMQLATGYMNVALPSSLARMAVNIRFFQRQGLSPPTAVAAGAIDSFASTAVQAVLLVLLLAFSGSTLGIELPFPSGGELTLLWILVGIVLLAVLVLVVVRRIRNVIVEQVRRWWPDVRAALATLRASNKLALIVLGSLATELLFAVALGFFARAFGYDISLAELLVINIGVSLLGTLVPIPGNIGVAEFGLAIGLTAAGMTEESALAAVLLYRISTYYLPPVWGFFALRWLQRNRYL